MKKFNYRITVNIEGSMMKLGFRGILPDEYQDCKIRVQAIFMQRTVERRFPMEVRLMQVEAGPQITADAEIELPYVFYNRPRHKVNVTFAVWADMEEIILNDQPFPVNKELFARYERTIHRNLGKFLLGCVGLPVLVAKNYGKEKNKKAALKKANAQIYDYSGYSFSPRQRKTDYFSMQYERFVKNEPVREKQILFLSERLPEKGGNLQLIKEWFEKKADPSIKITEFIQPKTVDSLTGKELKQCAALCAQAKVIILEDFYPQLHSIKIRPETQVVQLWHACGAFKTFGYTRLGKPGGAPQTSMNHRNYDLVTVSSEAIRGIYAEAFGISSAKVKALGVPRTDVLFDAAYKHERTKELYMKYPQLSGKKVVLFAPTFRGDGNKDAYYPPEAFDVNHFMEGMSKEVVCIVKHHPFVKQSIEISEKYKDCVLDLTGKDHINDLMLLTDLLITDYSSSVFEAAILGIPMLFYAFDKKEYIENRDFYGDFDHFAPGYIEEDFQQMKERARSILFGKEAGSEEERKIAGKKQEFIKDYLSALDGNSTEKIATYIIEKML